MNSPDSNNLMYFPSLQSEDLIQLVGFGLAITVEMIAAFSYLLYDLFLLSSLVSKSAHPTRLS